MNPYDEKENFIDHGQGDLRATWIQALVTFFGPLVFFLGIRWLLIEPFVIPSGSMIPNLLIHDHIFVNKMAYGLQNPFKERLAYLWKSPQRGDIVVFRYPENPKVFYIKRLIGLPGDTVEIRENRLYINNNLVSEDEDIGVTLGSGEARYWPEDENFRYFKENSGVPYFVRKISRGDSSYGPEIVPAGNFFMMGDNRDQSMDSRYWGFVPESHLVGKAALIWLSCESMMTQQNMICDFSQLRWNRLLKILR